MLKSKLIIIVIIIIVLFTTALSYYYYSHYTPKMTKITHIKITPISYVKIVVVVDNNPNSDTQLRCPWGLSIYIETNYSRILFDTGPSIEDLKHNLKVLGISPKSIDIVVISHEHGDHVGGLEYILQENNRVKVYLPAHSPDYLKSLVKKYGAKLIEVSKPIVISEGIATTGELSAGFLYEQSLIISVKGYGLIIVTGCSHPGIDNIVKYVATLTSEKIFMVIGG